MTDILQIKRVLNKLLLRAYYEIKELQQKSVHNLLTIPYAISIQKQRYCNQRYVKMPFYSLHIH